MKNYSNKVFFWICLIILLVLLGISIFSDFQKGEVNLSLHILVIIIGIVSCFIAIYRAKNELSKSEYNKHLIAFIITVLIMYILFMIINKSIIPKV